MKREKLRAKIKKYGLEQKFVAKKIKVDPADLNRAITGCRKTKRSSEIIDLAIKYLDGLYK